MYRADSRYNIPFNFAEILDNTALEHFVGQLVYIAAGKTEFNWEGVDHTIDGRQINVDVRWSVAAGYGKDLSKVIVSLQDITERKKMEDFLARMETRRATLERKSQAFSAETRDICVLLVDVVRAGGRP